MKILTSENSIDEWLSKHEYSLLYFTASWCGPCKSTSPVVESVSALMNERLNTIKIDVDNMQNVAKDYGIRSVPTLMLVKNDEIVDQHIGGLSSLQLIQLLEQHI